MSTPPPPPPPPPPYSDSSPSSLTRIIRTTLSYDTNVMLAAIISLLLVILFVLLLHLYTRWFLVQAGHRNRTSVTFPQVLRSRLHHRFTIIESETSPTKSGLPFSLISSLPLFVYHIDEDREDHGLECAICLSLFEQEEIGRKLPDCGHAFHVDCIDMWLNSHSSCPICRSQIQCNRRTPRIDQLEIEIVDSNELRVDNDGELRLEIVNTTGDQISEVNELTSEENSSKSCSSRSGGKIHPSSNVNDDESEV